MNRDIITFPIAKMKMLNLNAPNAVLSGGSPKNGPFTAQDVERSESDLCSGNCKTRLPGKIDDCEDTTSFSGASQCKAGEPIRRARDLCNHGNIEVAWSQRRGQLELSWMRSCEATRSKRAILTSNGVLQQRFILTTNFS